MKILKAPSGCNEAIFGEQTFAVDDKGNVTVPDEAVDQLLSEGFELVSDGQQQTNQAPPPPPAGVPVGHQKMMHPDGVGASWGGKSYEPGEDGAIVVPQEAVTALASHGFEAV